MKKTYIIAEIGINHNGSLDVAKKLIDVASVAGCDAVKFQKRNPDVCVPEHQKGVMRDTPWGTMTYLDYKYKVEFEKKERYCLVAIYRFDRDEKNFLKSKLTNGFRSNLHDTADPTDADGIVSACGALLKVGELKKTESDIREYLMSVNEYKTQQKLQKDI